MFDHWDNAEVLAKCFTLFCGFDGTNTVFEETLVEAPAFVRACVIRVIVGRVEDVGVDVTDLDCCGLVVVFIVVD